MLKADFNMQGDGGHVKGWLAYGEEMNAMLKATYIWNIFILI